VDHHLYSLDPLTLSVDTLGLKEDQSENRFIIVIVDNFSKLVGPAQNTTSKEFVRTLQQISGLRMRSAQMKASYHWT